MCHMYEKYHSILSNARALEIGYVCYASFESRERKFNPITFHVSDTLSYYETQTLIFWCNDTSISG